MRVSRPCALILTRLFSKWTNEVDSIFKEFIDVEARMTMHATALDDIRQTIAQGDTVVSLLYFMVFMLFNPMYRSI